MRCRPPCCTAGTATTACRSATTGLGFVCTGMTVDGMPGLEGYYFEYGRPLKEEERVRFAYGRRRCRASTGPASPGSRPRTGPRSAGSAHLPRLCASNICAPCCRPCRSCWARPMRRTELGRVARLVGLQFHEETARDMDLPTDVERGDLASARDFARWLAGILEAQGEDDRNDRARRRRRRDATGWRAVRELTLADPLKAFDAWNELWLGAAAAHDRFLTVQTTAAASAGRARLGDRPGVSRRDSPRQADGRRSNSASSANGTQRVSRCSWTQRHRIAAEQRNRQTAGCARSGRGRHFEQVLVERGADFDQKPGLLAHLARESRAMILARIRPATRQVPFAALVQQQQHAVLIRTPAHL